jgi:hypothetical protein
MKTRTKFVICSVINLIWFTLAVLVLTWFDKIVPDSLTVAWFSAWTVELALLAGIKIKGRSEDLFEEEYVDESEDC